MANLEIVLHFGMSGTLSVPQESYGPGFDNHAPSFAGLIIEASL
jgi:hypothetical protein